MIQHALVKFVRLSTVKVLRYTVYCKVQKQVYVMYNFVYPL